MLRWKSKPTNIGIRVRFQEPKLMSVLVWLSTLLFGCAGFVYIVLKLSLQTIGQAFISLLVCIPLLLIGMVIIVAGFFLRDSLRQRSYLFSKDGIRIETKYFWITAGSRFFLNDEICQFGLGRFPHTHTRTLKFFANGEYFNLATHVTAEEVNNFVQWLAENELAYSANMDPIRRGNSANNSGFLRVTPL